MVMFLVACFFPPSGGLGLGLRLKLFLESEGKKITVKVL